MNNAASLPYFYLTPPNHAIEHLQILLFLQPTLDILRIPLNPLPLRPHPIQTLRQTLIKPLRLPLAKPLLHLLSPRITRKPARADTDHTAQHAQSRRQFLLQLFPVLLEPVPEGGDAFGVRAQAAEGQVDVLAFDVGGEGEFEGAFDEGGGFGAAESAEGGVALVGGGALQVGVEDDFVLRIRVSGLVLVVGMCDLTSASPPYASAIAYTLLRMFG